jgi:hypothetical protein
VSATADTQPLALPTLAVQLDAATIELLADAVADRIVSRIPAAHDRHLDDDAILDSREAVSYLKLPSLDALHRETAAGTIPSLQRKPRGRLKFRKRDLDDWLAGEM